MGLVKMSKKFKNVSILIIAVLVMNLLAISPVSAAAAPEILLPIQETTDGTRILKAAEISTLSEGALKGQGDYSIKVSHSGTWNEDTNDISVMNDNGNKVIKAVGTNANPCHFGTFSSTHTSAPTIGDTYKYEIDVKMLDATENLYVFNYEQADGIYAGRRYNGIEINNGEVFYNPKADGSGTRTKINLIESLASNEWYRIVRYLDFDSTSVQKQRIQVYKVTNHDLENETTLLLGDTGSTWVETTRFSGFATPIPDTYLIGCMVFESNDGVLFDNFNGYKLTAVSEGFGTEKSDTTASLSFNFTQKMDGESLDETAVKLTPAEGKIDASFDTTTNKLTVNLSELSYSTDYTLTIGADTIKSDGGTQVAEKSITFSTIPDPKDAYRPTVVLNESENLSARNLKSADIDTIWNALEEGTTTGFTTTPAKDEDNNYSINGSNLFKYPNMFDTQYSGAAQPLRIGYESGTSGNIVLKSGDGASNNTGCFVTTHTNKSNPIATVYKYEVKVKLSNASDVVHLHVWDLNKALASSGNGITFKNNGEAWTRVGYTPTKLTLTEPIAAGVWYKVVKYFDLSDSSKQMQRIKIFKIINNGASGESETLICDTGETFSQVGASNLPVEYLYNNFGASGGYATGCYVESATGTVMFDDFNGYEFNGVGRPLSEETSVNVGTVAFDFTQPMKADTLNTTKVTLTADGKEVALTGVAYNAGTNQLNVTFPELDYETNYELTFDKDFMKTTGEGHDFGELGLKDSQTFTFSTEADPLVVASKAFVDASNQTIEGNTLNANDVIKGSVTLKRDIEGTSDYLIILALYDSEGSLEDIAVKAGTLSKTDADGEVITTDAITVPENGCKAKLMVWKNWADINPRTPKSSLPADN